MQMTRFVKTDSPANPYSIQMRDNKPWSMGFKTKFLLPFPENIYRPRSVTGKSFLRETK